MAGAMVQGARGGRGSRAAFVVLLLLALCAPAMAQVVPPPQTIPGGNTLENQRQLERLERQQQRPAQEGPSVVAPARPRDNILKPGGPRFLLKRLVFDESKFLTREELDPIAAEYTGRQVDFSELQKLIASINALYAKKSIPTGIATLPEQDVKDGTVKIKLTEGKLEKMSVTGAIRTRADYILQRLDHMAGVVLDVPRLAREVAWFNRTNDTQIRALLQPGTSFGLTDLQIATTEPPPHTWQLFWDNQGVKNTGRYQLGTYYRSHGPIGIDDRFTFYGVKSPGNVNGNVAYNLPFNPWGGRVGVSLTQGQIRVLDGPAKALDIFGRSKQAALNLSQPLIATEDWLIMATGAYSIGRSQTHFASIATTVTDDRTTKSTIGPSITHSSADHSITIAPAYNYVESRSAITQTSRYFDLYSGSGSLLLRLPGHFSISATGSGQYTREKLLPGDQLFQIGGPTTVRGYPTNAVAGDSGYYVNVELHNSLNDLVKGFDLYAFYDMGEVFSTFPPRTALYAGGAGASYTPHPSVTFEASFGRAFKFVVPEQPRYQAYFRTVFRPLLLVM
jgi:hemolysin activation/secretion protein